MTNSEQFAERPIDLSAFELIARLDVHFDDQHNWPSCERHLKFLTYEFLALIDSLHDTSESSKLQNLIEYLFATKGFRFDPNQHHLFAFVNERAGSGRLLQLLFWHLAKSIGLATWPQEAAPSSVVRCCADGKNVFVELNRHGQLLDDSTILVFSQKNLVTYPDEPMTWAIRHIEDISLHIDFESHKTACVQAMSELLKEDPKNMTLLGQRALLLQDLGCTQEAQRDLRKYSTFVSEENRPAELQSLLQTLHN